MRWRDVVQDSRQAVRAIVTSVLRQLGDAGERWQRTSFSASKQVRVILFRECERRGRKLLFDSKTVHKSENGYHLQSETSHHTTASLVVENGVTYEYSKPSGDLKMLGEMIFGSVAMSYQGATLKVHTIRSPPQLMVSVIFPAPVYGNRQDLESSGCFESSFGSESSAPGPSSVAHSVPVDVPGLCKNESASELLDSLDQWSADSSLTHSNSYSSFQRRFLNSITTSIEYGIGPRNETSGSLSEDTPGGRKIKLGLGVLISFPEEDSDNEFLRFQEFFFSHVALVEAHVQRLSTVCQQSFVRKHSFVGSLLEGVEQLKRSLQSLYCSPRLPHPPAWLALVGLSEPHRSHARNISTQLLHLIKHFDTKNTNFFVSTLLTGVLSSHLSWVSTVAPGSGTSQQRHPCGNQQYVRRESAQWLDSFAQYHPYNPLWVQLGDLYGAVGFPPKLCRILVVGRNSETVLRFLYVLSYFIRCSDICDKSAKQMAISDLSIIASPLATKTSSTSVRNEPANSVVFLLGDSPLHSPSQADPSELSKRDDYVIQCQKDTSLGYSSLPDDCRTADEELNCQGKCRYDQKLNKEEILEESPNVQRLQKSKLFMMEYNKLRFQNLSIECSEVKTPDCEDTEEGYHSMEDCPTQSCCSCMQHGALELEMPGVQLEDKGLSGGLGVSLQAGVSSHYSPDFCLQGLLSKRGHSFSFDTVMQDLVTYSQASFLGETHTITVLADTDNWQVHQFQSGPSTNEKISVSMSPLVAGICDSLLQMEQLSMSPEFCLMHLEDRLQELYFRSQSLASFLNERPSLGLEQIAGHLGLHCSDLPLLLAVATTNGHYV